MPNAVAPGRDSTSMLRQRFVRRPQLLMFGTLVAVSAPQLVIRLSGRLPGAPTDHRTTRDDRHFVKQSHGVLGFVIFSSSSPGAPFIVCIYKGTHLKTQSPGKGHTEFTSRYRGRSDRPGRITTRTISYGDSGHKQCSRRELGRGNRVESRSLQSIWLTRRALSPLRVLR